MSDATWFSYTVALILESVYGHRVTSLDDEYVTMMDRAMEATSASGPAGGGLADYFPLSEFSKSHCHLVLDS